MGYRGKAVERERARELRAQGWTLGEICEELDVSKASASVWCRDVEVDGAVLEARRRHRHLRGNEGARQRGPNALQRRKATEIEAARLAGRARFPSLGDDELLVLGLALYAGEGGKTDGPVRFTNTDPRLVVAFLTWFRRFFEPDEARLRVRLYLHADLDLGAATGYWSEVTRIPVTQFTRPHRAAPDPAIRRAKHPMGCATVSYSCTQVHREVMGLMDALLFCAVPCEVAQLVEHPTVNRQVLGSSPSLAARDGVAEAAPSSRLRSGACS